MRLMVKTVLGNKCHNIVLHFVSFGFVCWMWQILDDPTGNSFVENPSAPVKDAALEVLHYVRTRQQDVDLGCVVCVL